MGYQPLEDLLDKAGNSVYRLVRMASNRATELAEGKPRLLDKINSDKETTIALEEIRAGRIFSKETDDQNKKDAKASKKEK